MIKAVVFDLDDTLIAERQYVESGLRHIAALMEPQLERDAAELFETMLSLWAESPAGVFDRLFDLHRIPYTKEDIARYVAHYREHEPLLHWFEDVLPCLTALRRRGVKTGLITDGYAIAQRQKLKAIDGNRHFDEIIVTDELGRPYWKPRPEPFRLMRERLGVDYHEMAYIGDNPQKDFHIGSVHPIFTVRIDRGGMYGGKPYLDGVKERATIARLDELEAVLPLYWTLELPSSGSTGP